MNSPRLQAFLALIAVSAMWGVAGPVIKMTLNHIPPFTFLWIRFCVVGLITIPWYIAYLYRRTISLKDIMILSLFGLMSTTIHLSLIFLGIERTTSTEAMLIGSIAPIFIVLLGVIRLKEHVTSRELIGMGFVLLGTGFTILQPLLSGNGFTNVTGNSIILFSNIVFALFVFYSKKNFRHYSPLFITLHSSIVAVVTYFPLALIENGGTLPSFALLTSSGTVFFGIMYMAIVSYIMAYLLFEFGMSKIEISEGSIYTYIQPIFAAPVAVLWLHEAITVPFIIGATIIVAGVVLTERK